VRALVAAVVVSAITIPAAAAGLELAGARGATLSSTPRSRQVDQQTLALASHDVHYIATWLDYSGQYKLQIENMSPVGIVTSVNWVPPPTLRITAITSTQGGTCQVADSGAIACHSQIEPPVCDRGSCSPHHGLLTIYFTAALTGDPPGSSFSDLMWESHVELTGMTRVPPPFTDLPLCRHGQVSTRAKPCARR
jgi:hypothetical protein